VEYRVEYGGRVRDIEFVIEWACGTDDRSRNYWPLESMLSLLRIMEEK